MWWFIGNFPLFWTTGTLAAHSLLPNSNLGRSLGWNYLASTLWHSRNIVEYAPHVPVSKHFHVKLNKKFSSSESNIGVEIKPSYYGKNMLTADTPAIEKIHPSQLLTACPLQCASLMHTPRFCQSTNCILCVIA